MPIWFSEDGWNFFEKAYWDKSLLRGFGNVGKKLDYFQRQFHCFVATDGQSARKQEEVPHNQQPHLGLLVNQDQTAWESFGQ